MDPWGSMGESVDRDVGEGGGDGDDTQTSFCFPDVDSVNTDPFVVVEIYGMR